MGLRQDKIGDQIRDALALIFAGDKINDPRLSAITITGTKVSPDLQIATVHFRIFECTEKKRLEAAKGFESCSSFLRKKIASSLKLRRVPTLQFFYDQSIERGERVEKILNDLNR